MTASTAIFTSAIGSPASSSVPGYIKVTPDGHLRWQGKRIQFAGAHTWDSITGLGGPRTQLRSLAMPDVDKDKGIYPGTRLWAHIEPARLTLDGSQPWATGARLKTELLPWRRKNGKWDLSRISKRWLRRLKSVVSEAEKRDIITQVVLFDGAFNRFFGADEWEAHPMNPKNNIQNIGPTNVSLVHSKGPWNKYQRKLIRTAAEALTENRNVILEIANEPDRSSVQTGWYKNMIKTAKKASNAPVLASYVTRLADDWMRRSGADLFGPASMGQRIDLPAHEVADDDHAFPLRGDVGLLREAWQRGNSVLMMDGLNGDVLRNVGNLGPGRDFLEGLGG